MPGDELFGSKSDVDVSGYFFLAIQVLQLLLKFYDAIFISDTTSNHWFVGFGFSKAIF